MTAPSLTDYQAAEQELTVREARTGFRVHATVYALVIPILVLINLLAVPQFYWFEFPLLGWGGGLFMHYWFSYRKAAENLTIRQTRIAAATR